MSDIQFDETTHTYVRNNNNYISVTTLLKKYNLSANYSGIDPKVLANAAQHGTYVHKCLEDYIKFGVITDQQLLDPFISFVNNRNINLSKAISEEIVYDDTYLIAGTIDFQYMDGIDGSNILADFKATSSIHWDSVTWQTSIYNFIKCERNPLDYYLKRTQVIHISNGRFTVKELPLIPYEEVEKLLQANLLGLPYTYTPDYSSVLSKSESKVYDQICNEIAEYETILKDLKEKQEKMNKKIISNMEASKYKHFLTDEYDCTLITRKAPAILDKDKLTQFLRGYNEDINNFYKTNDKVSNSLKIKKIGGDTSTVIKDINKLKKEI